MAHSLFLGMVAGVTMGMRRVPECCIKCGEKATFPLSRIRGSQYYCTKCETERVVKYHQKYKDNYNSYQRRYYDECRKKILEYYGGNPPKCACCGETTYWFLTLDHINGDGHISRRKVTERNTAGIGYFRWIIRNNFPPGYQVLCCNCNYGKE